MVLTRASRKIKKIIERIERSDGSARLDAVDCLYDMCGEHVSAVRCQQLLDVLLSLTDRVDESVLRTVGWLVGTCIEQQHGEVLEKAFVLFEPLILIIYMHEEAELFVELVDVLRIIVDEKSSELFSLEKLFTKISFRRFMQSISRFFPKLTRYERRSALILLNDVLEHYHHYHEIHFDRRLARRLEEEIPRDGGPLPNPRYLCRCLDTLSLFLQKEYIKPQFLMKNCFEKGLFDVYWRVRHPHAKAAVLRLLLNMIMNTNGDTYTRLIVHSRFMPTALDGLHVRNRFVKEAAASVLLCSLAWSPSPMARLLIRRGVLVELAELLQKRTTHLDTKIQIVAILGRFVHEPEMKAHMRRVRIQHILAGDPILGGGMQRDTVGMIIAELNRDEPPALPPITYKFAEEIEA